MIGYAERDGGQQEIALPAFRPGGRIPWHRVQYIKQGTRRVWDRATRLDLTDQLTRHAAPVAVTVASRPGLRWDGAAWSSDASPPPPLPSTLTAVTWNVLQGRFDPAPERRPQRHTRLLERLEALAPDVIALQEVDPEFAARLLAAPWVRDAYTSSAGPADAALRPSGQLLLCRAPLLEVAPLVSQDSRRGVLARACWAERTLWLGSLHFTSAAAGAEAAARRVDELRLVDARLGGAAALLLGDLNARAGEPLDPALAEAALDDAWLALHPPAPTFEPRHNPLATANSQSGLPGRLDRALVRAPWLTPTHARRVGRQPKDGVWPSDHAGLRVALRVTPPALAAAPVYRSAVCLIPPSAAWPPIQAIRAEHDRGYARWPPHINLLYGFVPDPAAAVPALRAALRDTPAFALALSRFERFSHRASATVWLAPEPEAPLRALQADLQRAFPQCDEQGRKSARGFTPHLSVGGARRDAQAQALAEACAQTWRPLRALVDHVCVLARERDDPFRVVARVPLAGPAPVAERATVEEACALVADAAGVERPWVAAVGSRALGVAAAEDDLDLLVVTPHGLSRDDLFAGLPAALDRPAWVGGGYVPTLRVRGAGVALDVQAVEAPDGVDPGELVWTPAFDAGLQAEDRRALAAARDGHALRAALGAAQATARFRRLAAALRAWTRRRHLRGQAWGYLGGFGWDLLAAWAALAGVDDLADWARQVGDQLPQRGIAIAGDALGSWTLRAPSGGDVARQLSPATIRVLRQEWTALAEGDPEPALTTGPRLVLRATGEDHGIVDGALRRLLDALEAAGAAPRPLPALRAFGVAAGALPVAREAAEAWAATLPVRVAIEP